MKHVVFTSVEGSGLAPQIIRALEPVVGRSVSVEEALQLLEQGSVFREKVRWRDPAFSEASAEFEVFWPDLPLAEFTLDPRRIVWQDEHLLIVDKPAGVNSAPSPFSDRDCLTWGVQKLLGPEFAINAVHRLDRDTSGLMFFAKHKAAELSLHQMFRERRVRKVYRAVTPAFALDGGAQPRAVYRWRDTLDYRGKVQTAATTVLRSGTDGRGRFEWTVLPHTGRPHQIRRHFARYLVPLWGDRAYAPGQYGPDELGLACVAYRCRHPLTGEALAVERSPVSLDESPGSGDKEQAYLPPSSSG